MRMQLFVAEADLAVRAWVEEGRAAAADDVGVVIGLDANSLPGSAAALYLTGGGVPARHVVHAQAVVAGLRAPVVGIGHPLPLASACVPRAHPYVPSRVCRAHWVCAFERPSRAPRRSYERVLGREPSWTNMNYATGFVGAIDVIATNLAPVGVYDVPERPAWGLVVMPNAVMPSDHVPLEAVLACLPLRAAS